MERSKLEEFNHWWLRDKVDSELALPFKRDKYVEILKHLNKRFIILAEQENFRLLSLR